MEYNQIDLDDVVSSCIGDGWADIVRRLVVDLYALGWNGELHQLKEKLGGLRFYTGNTNEAMNRRIKQAESEAWKTCQNCGEPGKVRHLPWIQTLCVDHFNVALRKYMATVAAEIMRFLDRYAIKEYGIYVGCDPIELQHAMKTLQKGERLAIMPNSEWSSGCYVPFSDNIGKEWHETIIARCKLFHGPDLDAMSAIELSLVDEPSEADA